MQQKCCEKAKCQSCQEIRGYQKLQGCPRTADVTIYTKSTITGSLSKRSTDQISLLRYARICTEPCRAEPCCFLVQVESWWLHCQEQHISSAVLIEANFRPASANSLVTPREPTNSNTLGLGTPKQNSAKHCILKQKKKGGRKQKKRKKKGGERK